MGNSFPSKQRELDLRTASSTARIVVSVREWTKEDREAFDVKFQERIIHQREQELKSPKHQCVWDFIQH